MSDSNHDQATVRGVRAISIVAVPLLCVTLAALAGCGSKGADSTSASNSSPTAVSSAPSDTASESLSAPATSGTTTSGSPTPTSTTLAGEPYDRGPARGQVLAVAGVKAGNTLALRIRPGIDQQTASAMPSVTKGLVATGRARTVTGTIWVEVRFGGLVGWSAARYLVWLGDATDVTAATVKALGSSTSAATMLDLGRAVVSSGAAGAGAAEYTVTDGPTEGDLGEITIDVAANGDDAISGHRLHIVGTKVADGYKLKSVDNTLLCSRGVSRGLCV